MLFSSGPKYVLNRSSGTLPLLVPGLEYVGEVLVNCTDPVRRRAKNLPYSARANGGFVCLRGRGACGGCAPGERVNLSL